MVSVPYVINLINLMLAKGCEFRLQATVHNVLIDIIAFQAIRIIGTPERNHRLELRSLKPEIRST